MRVRTSNEYSFANYLCLVLKSGIIDENTLFRFIHEQTTRVKYYFATIIYRNSESRSAEIIDPAKVSDITEFTFWVIISSFHALFSL